MKLRFVLTNDAPTDQVADAIVIFEEAGLRGLSLAGFSVVADPEASRGIRVWFPMRRHRVGAELRSYWFLRGDKRLLDQLREDILREFERQHPDAARAAASRAAAAPAS